MTSFDISRHVRQFSSSVSSGTSPLSKDIRLDKLLKTVLKEVKLFAEDQIRYVRQYAKIGIALSVENDIGKLLEMIVDQARILSNADAGTLYTFDNSKEHLCFKIVQNDTLNIRMGGAGNKEINLPTVPMYIDGAANYSNVSSYVAFTGEMVNIPDVYHVEGFDFTGPRIYDTAIGYRTKSMLVLPLKNHENDIIGILQLLNSKNPETGEIIPFPHDYMDLIASLASQAAVALTNTQLIHNLQNLIKHIRRSTEIGRALSVENDIDKLLEDIVKEARDICNADGGTLYTVDEKKQTLSFKILHNTSLNIHLGGKSGREINLDDVPLHIAGKPNYSNVSSYVALTGQIVNIPDVYQADGFDFTGTRKYDEATGYQSKSMLVIPMKNHEGANIGVLQLLNSRNSDNSETIPFLKDYENLIASLASQAAVALTKTKLIRDLKNLLYAFIQTIATAVDKKSPYTAGHIDRVVKLTMMIANKVNDTSEGALGNCFFSEDELEELRLAAWMHDIGKITTPEYVIDKSTKLQTIFDRIALIETRFQLIAHTLEKEFFQKESELLRRGDADSVPEILRQEMLRQLQTLTDDLAFIRKCNKSVEYVSDDAIKRIQDIAAKTYSANGVEYPYLTSDEVANLCIRKGNLTHRERQIIENHAAVTYDMLKQLPFPGKLSKIAEYAGAHHEKLDGSGYSRGLAADQLSVQARIISISDIFEALTAKDRPYKEPMKLSQAIDILTSMKNQGHIDPDIFDLFMNSGLYRQYAEKELAPEQIDE